VNAPRPSGALDAPALEWLDRLLLAGPGERDAALARLQADEPALARRVARLLAACARPDASMLLDPLRAPEAAEDDGLPVAGAQVGGYRLLRELGRGGSAVVWLAEREDGAVRRAVALKLPLFTLGSSHAQARFERERDVLASLEHPLIARLYDAGVDAAGRPFIVLEHVDGEPVTAACDARHLGLEARLRVFLQVLDAVQHAHRHMVVHRDIKPSNVFLDAEGRVKLLDFGVAKLLAGDGTPEADAQLTREAGCALTPRYGAPEQFDGSAITAATDVYALGVLLYELLTGTLPHADALGSITRTTRAVLHAEPLRPSRATIAPAAASARGFETPSALAKALAGDLDTIVLKALRKSPAERYSSAERLADDLGRFLAHRPIEARPPSWRRRLGLFSRRHRAAVAAAAVGAAGALCLGVLLALAHGQAVDQRERADAVRDFMLDLVEDAEADQDHPGDATGRQMLRSGLGRAHERFAGQPRLLGEVLAELARMLARLDDDDLAQATLREAAALLASNAPADDPALNKARVLQAEFALAAGHVDEASVLAGRAHDACATADAECAKARAYALDVLAMVAGQRGQAAHALELSRRAVDETARGFGAGHAETAMAWQAHAVLARNAGDLRGAGVAMAYASEIAGHAVLRARDRLEIRKMQAVVDLDLGHFDAARAQLEALVPQAGGGLEGAVLQRLDATALLAVGDLDRARAAAARALALARPLAPDPEQWFSLQADAQAQSFAGRHAVALEEIGQARAGLAAAGFAAEAAESLRARRLEAEILARAGRLAEADTALAALADDLRARGDLLATEFGLVLDDRGRLLARAGRLRLAAALHEQARAAFLKQLPPGHPWLARNALYRAHAAWALGPTPASSAALHEAARAYEALFPPPSAWLGMAAGFLENPAGAAPTGERGPFVLP
jgi:serine/threonine-protein kinase